MPVSSLPTPSELRLLPLQQMTSGGRWRTEAMRSYRTPVLLWFTRGQGRITLAGTARGFGAHNAIFIPPRTMHGFAPTSQVFGTAIFFPEATDLPLPSEAVHLRIRDVTAQAEMTTLLEQLNREIESHREETARAVYHLSGLVTVWLDRQRAHNETQVPEGRAEFLARRFTEAVESQLYTGQSLAEYAEELGITASQLTQICHETCGRPAAEILLDRMTFEARRLLADTSLPEKRVSEILGYGSPEAFARAFQARTGESPGAFRQQQIPPAAAE